LKNAEAQLQQYANEMEHNMQQQFNTSVEQAAMQMLANREQ
jgi:hypothetical protein